MYIEKELVSKHKRDYTAAIPLSWKAHRRGSIVLFAHLLIYFLSKVSPVMALPIFSF